MAERGDVLQLKRRLGFGAEQEGERVVVVQANALNALLPTLVVVPLDPDGDTFAGSPLPVRIGAAEAGLVGASPIAMAPWIRVVRADQFAPGRVGKLRTPTLAELSRKLRLVLDL